MRNSRKRKRDKERQNVSKSGEQRQSQPYTMKAFRTTLLLPHTFPPALCLFHSQSFSLLFFFWSFSFQVRRNSPSRVSLRGLAFAGICPAPGTGGQNVPKWLQDVGEHKSDSLIKWSTVTHGGRGGSLGLQANLKKKKCYFIMEGRKKRKKDG